MMENLSEVGTNYQGQYTLIIQKISERQPAQSTLVVNPTLKIKDEVYKNELQTHTDKEQGHYLSYVGMLRYDENNKGDKV